MKKHLSELQVYSGIAILFVTFIHSNAYYLTQILQLKSYIDAGIFFNFIDKIVHVAVPMFIFIAGYKFTMNNKNEKFLDFLIKKVQAILLPFLTISIFCLSVHCGKYLIFKTNTSLKLIIYDFFKQFILIFFGINVAYQLWYIPMFLFLILTYPFLLKYIKNIRLRLSLLIFLLITWPIIVGHIHIPIISRLLSFPAFNFICYLYLYEIGSLFCLNKMYLKDGKKIILLYVITLLLSSLIKNKTHSSLFTIIVLNPISVMAFYYISIYIKNNKLFLILGKYSFYIFLFHEPYFISKISLLIKSQGLYISGLIAPVVSILSIILSIFLYKILRKLSIAKYLLGIRYKNVTIERCKNIQINTD
ncbi:acyltransferase family protein [Clostridium brassicae]|uniref:Acyltransferase family protein n=1 Tax=Clostridium brassicae TaxID=2999072 RepID=A0ABT4D8C5_9CLOT|nr:acyltransferase family protein [Clostridium brassicae]MCY6958541.1 acyltransferase family protein [Clostridium brassicae]